MKVYLLMDTAHSGAVNMAIDEVLGESVIGKEGEIAIRFYGWEPPTVSIGYNQPSADLDLDAVSRDGLGWVRRMTGGGGVLHWNEITYSIAIPYNRRAGDSRKDLFVFCAEILSALYRSLWIETTARTPGPYTPIADCFAAPGAHELVEKTTGKKIAGSATTIRKGYFLQHGSLPLDDARLRINSYLKAASSPRTASAGSVAIGDFVDFTRDEVLERFRNCLEEKFEVALFQLSGEMMSNACRLAEERYAGPKWAYRR
ncbi:MAG: biotin/lipoate A/B protein ligase family protein [PVC group bacterium]